MSDQIPNQDDLLRKALLVPCETKEALSDWLVLYMGLDFPDCVVDTDSTTSPMDAIWEMYQAMLKNNRQDMQRTMWYASRDSFKTLAAASIEILAMLHCGRDAGHMAAVESQALNSQKYVKQAFRRPYLRDLLVNDNETKVVVRWYTHKGTGEYITDSEFKRLLPAEQDPYLPHEHSVTIVICTIKGANSLHVPFFCVTGDTELFVPGTNGRDRKVATARGVFRRLCGLNPGGRGGGETELDIPVPAESVEVLSLNMSTGDLEFRKVLRGHRKRSKVLSLKLEDGKELRCTPDHPIYVWGKGFIEAKDIAVGDLVMRLNRGHTASNASDSFTFDYEEGCYKPPVGNGDEWDQVVLGSLLGDAGCYARSWTNPYLKEQHSAEQAEYLAWKTERIRERVRVYDDKYAKSGYTGRAQAGYRSACSPLFSPYLFFKETLSGIERLGPLGLAVWYMDDGCAGNQFRISSESFTLTQNEALAAMLKKNFDINAEVSSFEREGRAYHYIRGGVEAKRRLAEICAPYTHPTMAYKFDLEGNQGTCQHCGATFWFYAGGNNQRRCPSRLCAMAQAKTVQKVAVSAIDDAGEDWVYDFTVEGNHNFFGNGILNKNCVDEVDIAPPVPYEESKFIPTEMKLPDGTRLQPITLLISTRKTRFGIVQRELDEAARTKLYVKHWNIFEIIEACEPSRHHPEEPKVNLWVNDDTLTHLKDDDYKLLSEEKKLGFVQKEGFAGCADCPLFATCQGNLATRQKSKAGLLKSIDYVMGKMQQASIGSAKAQLLCRKPDTEGLVYPHFDPEVHCITAAAMAELMTGDEYPPTFGKADLIRLMKTLEGHFVAGLDHGYGHNFVIVSLFALGQMAFVFDVQSAPQLELEDKIRLMNDTVKEWDPDIYPDPEDPAANKTIRRHGFKTHKWSKDKGSVIGGIEAVRAKFRPAIGKAQMYLLKDDPGCMLLADRVSKYAWKIDTSGRPTNIPNDLNDDECFTGDTEALTGRGWVRLDEIREDDTVMAVDTSGRGAMERPEAVIRKNYQGNMRRIEHSHLEFTATENHAHSVMSQYDWKVKKRYLLQKRTVAEMAGEMYWANNLSSWPTGSGLFEQGADEAWVAGFWLAEGCFDTARPTFILLDQKKPQHQATLRETVARLGWRMSETHSKNGSVRFVLSSQGPRAAKWRALFGALSHKKRLDVESVLSMTEAERRAFWEGYMAGDGCRTGPAWHFDSVSKSVVDGIQVLTMSLGYGSRIVSYDCMRAGRTMTNPQGRSYVAAQSWRGHVLRKVPVAHIKTSGIQSVPGFSGMVYCVRTSTGSFLARTNGKPFVAGNCDGLRYAVMNKFGIKGKITVVKDAPAETLATPSGQVVPTSSAYLTHFIQQSLGNTGADGTFAPGAGEGQRGKKGKFLWDMG